MDNYSNSLAEEKPGLLELILTSLLSFVFWIILVITIYCGLAILIAKVTNFGGEFTGAPFWALIFVPLMYLSYLFEIVSSYNLLAGFLGLIVLQGLFTKTNHAIVVFRRATILAAILIIITFSVAFAKSYGSYIPMTFLKLEYILVVIASILLMLSSLFKYRKIWLLISMIIFIVAVPLGLTLKKEYLFSRLGTASNLTPIFEDEHLTVYEGKYNQGYQIGNEKVIFLTETSLLGKSDVAVFYVVTADGQRHSSFRNYNPDGFYDLYSVNGSLYRPQTRGDGSDTYDLVICKGNAEDCHVWYNTYQNSNWTPPPPGMPKINISPMSTR